MRRSFASHLLEWMLYLLAAADIVVVVSMPGLIRWYLGAFVDYYQPWGGYRGFLAAFLLLVGAGALWIIVELIFMVRSIPTGPFVRRNVTAFRRMGVAALTVSGIFFGKCIPYFTPLTLACAMILVLCSLLAFVLADLFQAAVAFKEENDLTI